MRELLAVVVAHDLTSVQFLDRPGRREAAIGHCVYVKQKLRAASCAELSWRLSTCGIFNRRRHRGDASYGIGFRYGAKRRDPCATAAGTILSNFRHTVPCLGLKNACPTSPAYGGHRR